MSLSALFDILLNNIAPVFLAAATGYLVGKRLKPDVRSISRITFYIFSPALVFRAIVNSQLSGGEFGQMALFTLLVVLISGGLALLVGRALRYPRPVMVALLLSVMFVNGGNFGLPINLYAFGEAGLARAVLYFAFSTVLVYSLGVFIAGNGRMEWRAALRNVAQVPALYALPLAGLVQMMGWQLPAPLQRPVDLLAGAAIPCMLVILGMQLAQAKFRSNLGAVSVAAGLRLLAGPAVGLLLAALLGLEGPLRQAAVLEAAMPTAVINTILAVEYDASPEIVTGAVVITTLLSPLTLTPLIAYLRLAG